MSDIVYQAIIGGVVTIILAYMQYRTQVAVKKSAVDSGLRAQDLKAFTVKAATEHKEEAAKISTKTDEVKKELAIQNSEKAAAMEDLTKVALATHVLVNSKYGESLRKSATALRKLADITKSDFDVNAASEAEKDLAIYSVNQSALDEIAVKQENKL